jgi:hypothetical protein
MYCIWLIVNNIKSASLAIAIQTLPMPQILLFVVGDVAVGAVVGCVFVVDGVVLVVCVLVFLLHKFGKIVMFMLLMVS